MRGDQKRPARHHSQWSHRAAVAVYLVGQQPAGSGDEGEERAPIPMLAQTTPRQGEAADEKGADQNRAFQPRIAERQADDGRNRDEQRGANTMDGARTREADAHAVCR